jgi:hypothetical protein
VIDQPGDNNSGVLLGRPEPTMVSSESGPGERRGRRSGQVSTKPCPSCGASVALDSRRIQVVDGQALIPCAGCSGRVPVRRSDRYRPELAAPVAPTDIAAARSRRAHGLGAFRTVRNRAKRI